LDEIIVPDYSRDDFTKGTAPFDWLYKFKDDKFKMAQITTLIKEKAGAVQVKNFMILWKAYLQTVTSKNGMTMDNTTNFDKQKLELATGEWIADDYGISTINRFGEEVIACNHPVMPIQRLVNIDTDTEKLNIAYKKRGKGWRSIIVDKKTLASANSIVSMSEYGIAVNSENSKYLVKYLTDIEALNPDAIEEISSVGRLGWIDGYGFSPYVDSLIFDGDVSFKHFFESVSKHGKHAKWVETAREARKQSTIAKIMLAASFASVLVNPCNALPFFVHLWGGTEAGKTVALMLAASVWANPSMGAYIHTFNGTAVAQELSATFVNSLPLIIDELQIIGDRKDFDKMIYQLSEGVGKGRGAKAGGLQKVGTWQNCIITSGEQPITNGSSAGGAVNRIIEIDCKDEKIFKDPVSVVDSLKKHYGSAGEFFIEKLTDNDNEILNRAKQLQKDIYKELSKGQSTEKQIMAASVILTADALIDELIFKDGNKLTNKDIEPYLMTKQQISQGERAYEFLFDFIAVNRRKFETNSFGDTDVEVWGTIDVDYVYIIKSQFDKIMQNEGFNPSAFLSWMKQKSLLKTKEKRNTIDKRIFGNVCNVIAIKQKPDFEETIDLKNLANDIDYDLPN